MKIIYEMYSGLKEKNLCPIKKQYFGLKIKHRHGKTKY